MGSGESDFLTRLKVHLSKADAIGAPIDKFLNPDIHLSPMGIDM
jgi:hypothetical protein